MDWNAFKAAGLAINRPYVEAQGPLKIPANSSAPSAVTQQTSAWDHFCLPCRAMDQHNPKQI